MMTNAKAIRYEGRLNLDAVAFQGPDSFDAPDKVFQ